ncbi:hypothetical protein SAVIM40S_06237 [Streptomyces avidinii]
MPVGSRAGPAAAARPGGRRTGGRRTEDAGPHVRGRIGRGHGPVRALRRQFDARAPGAGAWPGPCSCPRSCEVAVLGARPASAVDRVRVKDTARAGEPAAGPSPNRSLPAAGSGPGAGRAAGQGRTGRTWSRGCRVRAARPGADRPPVRPGAGAAAAARCPGPRPYGGAVLGTGAGPGFGGAGRRWAAVTCACRRSYRWGWVVSSAGSAVWCGVPGRGTSFVRTGPARASAGCVALLAGAVAGG